MIRELVEDFRLIVTDWRWWCLMGPLLAFDLAVYLLVHGR